MTAPTRILGIDPGNEESAYALIDGETCGPILYGKVPNNELRDMIYNDVFWSLDHVNIEMVASYGMPVGKEVFETCVWIGRFFETFQRPADIERLDDLTAPQLVYRREVKLHICHSPKANDATIRQALVDRFAPGEKNHGKGTKQHPGWFHGFRADIWQAYAVAVTAADRIAGRL